MAASPHLAVSSCEVPDAIRREVRTLLRFDPSTFRWAGVGATAYKPAAEAALAWEGVVRHVLVGAAGEPTAFQLRYFEIAPGGFSSFERHTHAHAVVVLRGQGLVRIGDEALDVGPFDVVCIPPDTPHQFRNPGGAAFGFLCAVDAVRDAPRPVEASDADPRAPGLTASRRRPIGVKLTPRKRGG